MISIFLPFLSLKAFVIWNSVSLGEVDRFSEAGDNVSAEEFSFRLFSMHSLILFKYFSHLFVRNIRKPFDILSIVILQKPIHVIGTPISLQQSFSLVLICLGAVSVTYPFSSAKVVDACNLVTLPNLDLISKTVMVELTNLPVLKMNV